ncbi:MAG: GTPase Era [Ignavibacteria bacterium]|nr:GTPase Era [Ignavibacteria bacterium]
MDDTTLPPNIDVPAAPPPDFRAGFVAIIGEPNVGKSTFLNAVLGTKLSIVTNKPQTTRRQVLGFQNGENHQIIFVDTPGLIAPAYALQRSMVESAHRAVGDADALLVLLEAGKALSKHAPFPDFMAAVIDGTTTPAVLAINKMDQLSDKSLVLPMMKSFSDTGRYKAVVPMCALVADNVQAAISELVPLLPLQPPLYPADMLSDQPERFFVTEIIREKIFEQFRQEVPYATEVVIAEYREEDTRDFIAADILVERDSQKRILIGAKGAAIKAIGTAARADIEEFLGRHVYLELHVKVREGWRDNEDWVRRLGYNS